MQHFIQCFPFELWQATLFLFTFALTENVQLRGAKLFLCVFGHLEFPSNPYITD